MKKIFKVTLVICMIFISSIAWGATIRIPTDQPNIQAGIDSASNGDTVLVEDGTYAGSGNKNLDFQGKSITVKSENGANNSVIDCENSGRGFVFQNGETALSVVDGLTITNGGSVDYGAGILCENGSSPTIKNNIIVTNTATVSGGGIASFDSVPIIENNEISNNTAQANGGGGGGGIYCNNENSSGSSLTIMGNVITGNIVVDSPDGSVGGGITCSSSDAKIENNTISSNQAADLGGGIYSVNASSTITNNNITGNQVTGSGQNSGGGIAVVNPSQPMINNNTINGNSAPNGGGIVCGAAASPTIQNNDITNNLAPTGAGGGILCNEDDTDPIIQNNNITNNSAYTGGGGIACGTFASPTIRKNFITNNSALGTAAAGTGLGGGIACGLSTHPTITNNVIASNTAERYGGGIACNNASSQPYPSITNNTLTGNSATTDGNGLALFTSGATVINTILWDGGNEIYNNNLLPGGLTVTYCDVQGGYTGGTNIIDSEPLLGQPHPNSGLMYDLLPGSPCISAGTLDGAPSTDIADRIRPLGSGVDIGAYEQNDRGTLAIELSTFTASIVTSGVQLKWKTESEMNNLGFNIYRSNERNGNFSKINSKLVKGHGTTATPHSYSFTDETAKTGQTYYYYIEDTDYSGKVNKSHILKVIVEKEKKLHLLPKETVLMQNYPNPFNPETWIPFSLSESSNVAISIYNIQGQLIRNIELGKIPAGVYISRDKSVYWNGKDNLGRPVASGVYYYTLHADDYTATKTMVIMK